MPHRSSRLLLAVRGLLLGTCLLVIGCAAHGLPRRGETIYKDVLFASPQGRDLRMDLYVPETAHRNAPVVVWIFGGSWKMGSKGYHVNVRDLTRSGIAVASIQYRLSSTAKYPAQLDDCRTAVRWLRTNGSNYGIDPNRIGASGESAGGHLAALLGTVEGSPGIRAVFALYPPTDLVTLSGAGHVPRKSGSIDQLLGGRVEQNLALAREASPVNRVNSSSPPFLIIHGAHDKTVPLEQSEALQQRLASAHVPVQLSVVPDKGHWFRLDEDQKTEVARFFQLHFRMHEPE